MVKMDKSLFASFSSEKEESFSTMETDPPSPAVNARPRDVAPSDQVEMRVVGQVYTIAIVTLPAARMSPRTASPRNARPRHLTFYAPIASNAGNLNSTNAQAETNDHGRKQAAHA